jgi:hypothetical protein
MGHRQLGNIFTFLYVDVRTSQEIHLWALTICCGDSLSSFYEDVLASQETHMDKNAGENLCKEWRNSRAVFREAFASEVT